MQDFVFFFWKIFGIFVDFFLLEEIKKLYHPVHVTILLPDDRVVVTTAEKLLGSVFFADQLISSFLDPPSFLDPLLFADLDQGIRGQRMK